MSTEYIVVDGPARVRPDPSTTNPEHGMIATGQHVQVIEVVNGWAKVALTAGQAPVVGAGGLPAFGWVYAGLLQAAVPPAPPVPPVPTPTPAPAPVPAKRTRLGVNIIGGNKDVIEYWYAAGCRRFQITFNPDAACELKQRHPDCTVTHRALFYGGHLPSLDEFKKFHGPCLTKGAVDGVFGLNENNQGVGDGGTDGSQPEDIRKRAEWDSTFFDYCAGIGVTFYGGGFAHGTPNMMSAVIREYMRRYYAPLVNRGMIFNQHCYGGNDHSNTPALTRIHTDNWIDLTLDGITKKWRQTCWLEERARAYTYWCGFDPDKAVFASDEGGYDGPGPFDDYGFTLAQKLDWAGEFVKRASEPLNGMNFNLRDVCLFADGDYDRWGAFARSIRPMAPGLATIGVY